MLKYSSFLASACEKSNKSNKPGSHEICVQVATTQGKLNHFEETLFEWSTEQVPNKTFFQCFRWGGEK